MKLNYPILLRMKDGTFEGFWSPDLNRYFTFDDHEKLISTGIFSYSAELVLQHIQNLRSQKIPIDIPEDLSIYRLFKPKKNELWSEINIDFERKSTWIENFFYIGSNFINVISVGTWAFMTILAVDISSGSSGNPLGFVSAAFSVPITLLVYSYSGTPQQLSLMGARIEKYFRLRKSGTQDLKSLLNNNMRGHATCGGVACFYFVSFILVGGTIANSFINNFTTYVDFSVLNDKAQEKGTIFPKFFVNLIIYFLVFSTFLAKTTFDLNFLYKLVQACYDYFHPIHLPSAEIEPSEERFGERLGFDFYKPENRSREKAPLIEDNRDVTIASFYK